MRKGRPASSDVSTVFPTFCHISELGTLGYGNLHRMLAMSSPLNLWAPSSVLLRDPGCRIAPDEFVGYVRDGYIRVVARREWLSDRRTRDRHPWEGARWDPDVDGELRSIMEEDEASGLTRAQRRVVAAEPETGWKAAKDYITQNPAAAQAWEAALHLQDRDGGTIPPGTLDEVNRRPDEVLLTVLRDAFNHGSAIRESDAEIPLLLRPEDKTFLDLMAEIRDDRDHSRGEESTRPPSPGVHADIAELTGKMIEALQKIETDRTELDDFVGTQEQGDFLRWIGAVCSRIKIGGVRAANIDVTQQLAEQLRAGKFPGVRVKELLWSLEAGVTAATAVDVTLAASGLVSNADALGIVGFVASAFPVGYGMCKTTGLVPGPFNGPQWPFLYAGTKSSRRTRKKIVNQLDPARRETV